MGFQTIRLPFNLLRAGGDEGTLNPTDLAHISVRFEPRTERAAVVIPGAGMRADSALLVHAVCVVCAAVACSASHPAGLTASLSCPSLLTDVYDSSKGEFKLLVDFIKVLPGGQSTDFVLVSCSGGARVGLDGQERDKVMGFKRKGRSCVGNAAVAV